VGSMLSAWMKTFWSQDFETQPSLMEQLEGFLDAVEHNSQSDQDKRVGLLLSKMRGIFEIQCAKFSRDSSRRQVKHKAVIAKMMGKPHNFAITDVKAGRLAEQLTLMHFVAFKRITKRECLGQRWKKADNNVKAPHILGMIRLFNETAKWVQILVLTQPTLSKRARLLKLCISVATYMKDFRNFSGSCAFHSALTSTPIHRLKMAWSKLSASDLKKFKQLKDIFGFGSNWVLLRKLHRTAHSPAVLHTGLFLQDLVGLDEGHANHQKDGSVNFKKLLKLHEKIDTIAMYQQEEYQFKHNLVLQHVIKDDFKAQQNIDDDFLFKISESVKASDLKKK